MENWNEGFIAGANHKNVELLKTQVEQIISAKNKEGLLTMVNTGGSVPLTTTYQKIAMGGIKVVQEQNGHFDYDLVESKLNIITPGIYRIAVCGSIEFPASKELELSCFVNGVEYSPDAHPQLTGRGTNKPTQLNVHLTLELNAGDYMEMFAKVNSSVTIDLLGNNISIEKKVYTDIQ